eukprot:TRINITY_DN11356_c0_g1_i1.p1 TRINITY_DN11356_c0_g1~~TRINITY_DN11356_c0_g1_i1.p1  ORF type:complete len:101 (+),score=8.31 TRINITY_DN11356_c0_g1_i1:215-517(+)
MNYVYICILSMLGSYIRLSINYIFGDILNYTSKYGIIFEDLFSNIIGCFIYGFVLSMKTKMEKGWNKFLQTIGFVFWPICWVVWIHHYIFKLEYRNSNKI